METTVFQVLLLVVAPYVLTRLTIRAGTQEVLSPVVLCYLLGMGLRNLTSLPADEKFLLSISQGSIILAIPLLLFATDIKAWLRLAPKTILAFVLLIVSVLVSSGAAYLYFRKLLPGAAMLGSMLSAVYIGGTPNMNAVGVALGAPESTFVTLNAAEMLCGGTWLILLTTLAPRFFSLFLKPFDYGKVADEEDFYPVDGHRWRNVLIAFALTLVLSGIAVALVYTLFGTLDKPGILLLLLSAFAIAASLWKEVRQLNGSFQSGEYLLLIFCIAIGWLADIGEIINSGGSYIAYSGSVLLGSVLIHLGLCRLFRIDRDTMVITNTAGLYGPPFIGQIAAVLKNRSIVVSGLITSLVGLAIANFIGVALASLLNSF